MESEQLWSFNPCAHKDRWPVPLPWQGDCLILWDGVSRHAGAAPGEACRCSRQPGKGRWGPVWVPSSHLHLCGVGWFSTSVPTPGHSREARSPDFHMQSPSGLITAENSFCTRVKSSPRVGHMQPWEEHFEVLALNTHRRQTACFG